MKWISSRPKIFFMLLPALIIFTMFVAYPVVYSLAFSFTKFQGFSAPKWIGAQNYSHVLQDGF
ncbi:MAG TPA: sugar ABC transporter permease, partial [Propionibacteriaceae bacterium]|nr:sugar ABC transporter permease [Propionibacteriaceae bacterium]